MFTIAKVKPSLMNVKVAKDDVGSLRTTPTNAIMRISRLGAEILGFQAEDYIRIIPVTDEHGNDSFAVCKGKEGDENTPNSGSKLAAPSKSANGTLGFSAAHAYNELGGGPKVSMVYRINPESVEFEGETYWQLIKHEEVPVTPRVAGGASSDEDDDDNDNVTSSVNA